MERQLAHHGILGMKWGVRRTPAQLGHKPTQQKKKDDLSKVSDEELRKRLNRLDMERRYKQLTSEDKKRGSEALKTSLKVVAAVSTVTTAAITIKNNVDTIRKWMDG